MNIFAIAGLICSFFCTSLAIVALIFGRAKIHRILAYFNFSVAIWGFGGFIAGIAQSSQDAIVGWRIAHVGGVFVSTLFFHLVSIFCKVKKKHLLIFAYAQAVFFVIINLVFNQLIVRTRYVYGIYYNDVNSLFALAVIAYLIIVFASFRELLLFFPSARGGIRVQTTYLIFSFFVGFLSGTSNFLPEFRIDVIYPGGNFGVALYSFILSYAILKYRLLDFNLVITRTSIFITVYSLVLGIPFALAFGWRQKLQSLFSQDWWLAPLIVMTVLATAGPFIYLYIQNRAEARLFQEQRRYQATLRQASYGMGRIKDLKRLLNLIVHIVTRTVGIEFSTVYINDQGAKSYRVGASSSRAVQFHTAEQIDSSSPLIEQLKSSRNPVVYEEIKQRTQDYGDHKLAKLETALKNIDAAVVVPSFIDENLIAFLVLGKKASGRLYSDEDLTVFSILANQAALAIENALFYDDVKKTHEQLYRAEKMATIGTMADGLSHQINNRLHALGFIAGDALDSIKLKKNSALSPDLQELMIDLEHALARIQDNVEQGGEIVRGLLKYTRKGEEGFTQVDLDKLIDASVEMT